MYNRLLFEVILIEKVIEYKINALNQQNLNNINLLVIKY